MKRMAAMAAAVLLLSGRSAAPQGIGSPSAGVPGAQPPASEAGGLAPEPAQMSGVPLPVGDLPPGSVAVRVIRRRFQDNLTGQMVRVRRMADGRVLSAATGPDGRAQFDGLSPGEQIEIRAQVETEYLKSQPILLPAQGGIRLVLVAGVGAATAATPDWSELTSSAVSPAPASQQSAPSAPLPGKALIGSWGLWVVAGLGVACVFAGMALRRRRRASGGAVGAADGAEPRAPGFGESRAEVFEELVRLEKDFEAGRASGPAYVETRAALIDTLAMLDLRATSGRATDSAR